MPLIFVVIYKLKQIFIDKFYILLGVWLIQLVWERLEFSCQSFVFRIYVDNFGAFVSMIFDTMTFLISNYKS